MMVLDGVLERHRALRGGVIELGAGWVPSTAAPPRLGGEELAASPSRSCRRFTRTPSRADHRAAGVHALRLRGRGRADRPARPATSTCSPATIRTSRAAATPSAASSRRWAICPRPVGSASTRGTSSRSSPPSPSSPASAEQPQRGVRRGEGTAEGIGQRRTRLAGSFGRQHGDPTDQPVATDGLDAVEVDPGIAAQTVSTAQVEVRVDASVGGRQRGDDEVLDGTRDRSRCRIRNGRRPTGGPGSAHQIRGARSQVDPVPFGGGGCPELLVEWRLGVGDVASVGLDDRQVVRRDLCLDERVRRAREEGATPGGMGVDPGRGLFR